MWPITVQLSSQDVQPRLLQISRHAGKADNGVLDLTLPRFYQSLMLAGTL